VKSNLKKYWKLFLVALLLVNFTSTACVINAYDCACKNKVISESKPKTCCNHSEKKCDSQKTEKKKDCKACNNCWFEKSDAEKTASFNSDNSKVLSSVSNSFSGSIKIFNEKALAFEDTHPPGVLHKIFLFNSILRI